MIHHGDEEIKKHDDVDDGEAAEHDETPESREFLDPCQLEVVQVYQTESRPKQCLSCLPQTTMVHRTVTKRYQILFRPYFANFL